MSPTVNIYTVTNEDGSTSVIRDDFTNSPLTVPTEKLSGGSVSYYSVGVGCPTNKEHAYVAECGDIIDALQLTFNEGCIFKEIWRTANARLGNGKPGNTEKRAAEKIAYYANRILDNISK